MIRRFFPDLRLSRFGVHLSACLILLTEIKYFPNTCPGFFLPVLFLTTSYTTLVGSALGFMSTSYGYRRCVHVQPSLVFYKFLLPSRVFYYIAIFLEKKNPMSGGMAVFSPAFCRRSPDVNLIKLTCFPTFRRAPRLCCSDIFAVIFFFHDALFIIALCLVLV